MAFSLNSALVRRAVFAVLAGAALLVVGSFVYKKIFPKVVFVSRFPDMWYPRDSEALKITIQALFERAVQKYGGAFDLTAAPSMLIVPHAGYAFSGDVAAAGYQYLLGEHGRKISRVIVLSPSHYVDFYGMCVPDFTHYQTPLGLAVIDTASVKKLEHEPMVTTHDTVFHREHAIDVQIPWIQTCLPKAKILPLIIGRLVSEEMIQHLGDILARCMDESTLVVISTDLVHYGKRFSYTPFGTDEGARKKVEKIEKKLIDACLSADKKDLDTWFEKEHAAVCGKNVMRVAFAMAAREPVEIQETTTSLQICLEGTCVARANSFDLRQQMGEDLADYERVGYAAIAFFNVFKN